MLEQMDGSYNNPYKFDAKELDEDTGLYYYGARYYNPRLSIWYGVDPLAIYNPVIEKEFYGDGQHNGGVYFWGNLNPYIYTYQNPIKYIDPNGKQVLSPYIAAQKISNGLAKLWNHVSSGWSQQYSTKTNADKYGGLERYRQWQANPGYNEGEGKYDRIFRLMGNSHREEMLDFGGGGYNMFGGYGRVNITNVELMGGESSSLKGYLNFDINAKVGIADNVSNFGKYFKPGSLKNIVVNNPQAAFLEEISGSLSKEGEVTIRGTMSNKYFNSIWKGKAQGLENYRILNQSENVPNNGYLQTNGKPIQGKINQIILQKK
ncbi:RHS repeat-associated core domain-containing protein [Chryseobacterium sp. NRRL B-14859]|uniref:RHS repeat domain-containing protein n=1 Tax=Chryseobacterium sp. NRRL B-14859 TaxID=1562763 RepID=UPI00339A46BA